MTFAGRFVASILNFVRQKGVDPSPLLAFTGHTWESLMAEDCRLPSPTFNRLIAEAITLSGDPSLGFHYGCQSHLSAAGLITQISQTSATVQEALQQASDFYNLGCQAIPMVLRPASGGAEFCLLPNPEWQAEDPQAVRQIAEGMLVFQWRLVQSLTFQQYQPRSVSIASPALGRASMFARAYGQSVHFDQPVDALWLDEAQLQAPVHSHDYRLLRVLVAHAEKKLKEQTPNTPWQTRIRAVVLNSMSPTFPSLEQVADTLHVSVRTLQRRLGKEGNTYKELLEAIRKELATQYLQDPSLGVSEVSELLGYAEVSAFSRSFRRWLGQSPQQYRNQRVTAV